MMEILAMIVIFSPVALMLFAIIVIISPVALKLNEIIKSTIKIKHLGNQCYKNGRDNYDKIHPEYKGLVKELLKEKEEKELRLNTIKLLNKELESVKKIDEEIKDLLKV